MLSPDTTTKQYVAPAVSIQLNVVACPYEVAYSPVTGNRGLHFVRFLRCPDCTV